MAGEQEYLWANTFRGKWQRIASYRRENKVVCSVTWPLNASKAEGDIEAVRHRIRFSGKASVNTVQLSNKHLR